ncbi:MAG: hypothetical protein ACXW3Z_05380 [Limisphaerales bacterium]
MNSSPEDFKDLRRLLAMKKHEQPPPGYFSYLPDKIQMRIEREEDLSEYSTWWEWFVRKLDAQPVLAGAYAFAISGLMLMGFKVSQDLQHETGTEGLLLNALDPNAVQPNSLLQKHFANPAPLLYFSEFTSTEAVMDEPAPVATFKTFTTRQNFAPALQ